MEKAMLDAATLCCRWRFVSAVVSQLQRRWYVKKKNADGLSPSEGFDSNRGEVALEGSP